MKRFLTLIFVLSTLVAFAQPANDECYNATVINLVNGAGGAGGTMVAATESNNPVIYPNNCLTSISPLNDVWFTFNTGASTDFKITVDFDPTSGMSPAFDLMRGACNAPPGGTFLLTVGCQNNSPAVSSTIDAIYTGLDPNTDYFIRVAGYGGVAGIIDTVIVDEYCPPFVLNTNGSSTKCKCGLVDSGGPNGDYGPLENYTYTINPSDPHTYIDLNFSTFAFEPAPAIDKLTVYLGTSVDPDSFFTEICDQGSNTTVSIPTTGAITLLMRSDGTTQAAGFEMEWECTNLPPPPSTVSNCVTNTLIPSLPFTETGGSTCESGNNFDNSDACGSAYMDGNDYVYTYNSPGDECINVKLTGTGTNVGVFVMDGCPLADATKCLAFDEEAAGNPEVVSVYLEDAGTYYIVISSLTGGCGSVCTSFDITVQNAPCPLDVDDNVSADSLVNTIAAQGVLVQNAVLNCPQSAYGIFTGGVSDGSDFMDGGIVLSTGKAKEIKGPNKGTFWASSYLATPGDSLLSALAGTTTFDACILEFDVYAPNDKLIFDYMFMSEEYNEAVGSAYSDVFAFLLSGPGVLNGTDELNLAYLPNTTTPVSVNTVNNNTNNQYYVDNDNINALNWFALEHDGHTTILQAEADVIPCNWYHVRLATADVNDAAMDSGVLIEANSLFSNAATISSSSDSLGVNGTINAAEACANGQFRIELFISPPAGDSAVIVIENSQEAGQATEGVDYGFLPDSLVFYPNVLYVYYPGGVVDTVFGGVTSYDIPVVPTVDGIAEPAEPLTIFLLSGCATPEPYDSATIIIRDELSVSLPDTVFVCGQPIPMPITGTGLDFATWNTSIGLSDSTILQPMITAFNDTTYTVEVSNGICRDTLSTKVIPYRVNVTGDGIFCEGGSSQVQTQANLPGYTYNWEPTTGLSCTNCAEPTIQPPVGSYTYFQIYTSPDGSCTDTNYIFVDVLAIPTPDLGDDLTICEGETVALMTTDEGISYTWTDDMANNLGNTSSINVTPVATTTYSLLADNGQCDATDDVTVNVGGDFTLSSVPSDTEIDLGESVTVTTTLTQAGTNNIGNVTYSWSPTDGLSCTDCAEPVMTPTTTTTYTLTVTSASGCEESVTFTIDVFAPEFAIPNLFSPNGDTRNDRFKILTTTNLYTIEKFNVFDRWGQVVYSTTTDQNGWDGTFNGEDMPQDTYVYNIVIRLANGVTEEFNGEVLLVR